MNTCLPLSLFTEDEAQSTGHRGRDRVESEVNANIGALRCNQHRYIRVLRWHGQLSFFSSVRESSSELL